jgi:Zn ribbon nucleic-acid-binding protein
MISRPTFITKIACPGCGTDNRIAFEPHEMLREVPCMHCGAIVRWKRKPHGSGEKL